MNPDADQAIQYITDALLQLGLAKSNLEPTSQLPPAGDPYIDPLQAYTDLVTAMAYCQAAISYLSESTGDPLIGYVPSSFIFIEPVGPQELTLSNTGEGVLVANITSETSWITISPSQVSIDSLSSAAVLIGVDWASVPPGTPDPTVTSIEVTSNAANQTSAIVIEVNVDFSDPQPDPILNVSPSNLQFDWDEVSSTSVQPFSVWNSGGGQLDYTIAETATWMSVAPDSGTSSGEVNQHDVTVDWDAIADGQTVQDDITVSDSGTPPPPPPPPPGGASSEHLDHDTAKTSTPGVGSPSEWTILFDPTAPGNPFDAHGAVGLAQWESRTYAGWADQSLAAPRAITLARTPAGGDIFANVQADTGLDFSCITPSPDLSAILATETNGSGPNAKIWRSTDGATWAATLDDANYTNTEAIFSIPESNVVVAAVCNDHLHGAAAAHQTKIYVSTDNGLTWTAGPVITNFYCLKLLRMDTYVYAFGAYNPNAAMWDTSKTYTMGYRAHVPELSTWTKVLDATDGTGGTDIDVGPIISGSPFDGKIYIGSFNSFDGQGPQLLTSTNGTTWSKSTSFSAVAGGTKPAIDVIFVHNGILYVVVGDGGGVSLTQIYTYHSWSPLKIKEWSGTGDYIHGCWGAVSRGDELFLLLKQSTAANPGTRFAKITHPPSAGGTGNRPGFQGQTESVTVTAIKTVPPPPPPPPPPPSGCCSWLESIHDPQHPIHWINITSGCWNGWCKQQGTLHPDAMCSATYKGLQRRDFYYLCANTGDSCAQEWDIKFPNDTWYEGASGGYHLGGWGLNNRVDIPYSIRLDLQRPNDHGFRTVSYVAYYGTRVPPEKVLNGYADRQVFWFNEWTHVKIVATLDRANSYLSMTYTYHLPSGHGADPPPVTNGATIPNGDVIGEIGELVKWSGMTGSLVSDVLWIRNDSYYALNNKGEPKNKKRAALKTSLTTPRFSVSP